MSHSKPHNIIFLDVDGVLNKGEGFHVLRDQLELLADLIVSTEAKVVLSSAWRRTEASFELVKNSVIHAVAENMRVKEGRQTSELEKIYDTVGMVVIGITPLLGSGPGDQWKFKSNTHLTRTDEILLWLRENVDYDDFEYKNVEKSSGIDSPHQLHWENEEKIRLLNFVVLDDLPLHNFSCFRQVSDFSDHFVRTKTFDGLTPANKDDAEKILLSEFNPSLWAKNTFVSCNNPNCMHQRKYNSTVSRLLSSIKSLISS